MSSNNFFIKSFSIYIYMVITKVSNLSIFRLMVIFQSLSKQEKTKKKQYGLERYKNLPEDEKQGLIEKIL